MNPRFFEFPSTIFSRTFLRVVGLPSTSGGGAGGEGPKKRRREKQAPHDQSDAIFKDDDEERVSRKRDIMGEVLELLKKNEEGGGRTREMGLQALVSQQSTMTNTITSLLQQARLLKEELRQAEDSSAGPWRCRWPRFVLRRRPVR